MKKIIVFMISIVTAVTVNAQSTSFQWTKGMRGSLNDWATAVAVDASGNVYTTGVFNGTVDFDPGAGVFNLTSFGVDDIFISKLDAAGNFVWAKHMGGTAVDEGLAIALDVSGNIYTTGYFQDTADFDPGAGTFNLISAGGNDIFISKLDASGNFVWAKNMGGSSYDQGLSIAVDASGNVYTTGYFQNTADFDPGAGVFNLNAAGNKDIFISKLDAAGNFMWAKSIGDTLNDSGYSIAVDASGNVYTTGYFHGTVDFDPGAGTVDLTAAGFADIFISKLDASGNFVWAKNMDEGSVSDAYGNSITLDGAGNIYITGDFMGTVDFDPGAAVFNLTDSSSYSIYISKYDAAGNFTWAKQMEGTSTSVGMSVVLDAAGNVYTTGHFAGTVDFDPGAGTFNLSSIGVGDIYISKLDASGNFMWAKQMGGTSNDIGYSIAVDASGDIYTAGTYEKTVDFDPGAGTFYLTSDSSSYDIFVQKISQTTVGINENTITDNISIYPNPSNGVFNISISNPLLNNVSVEIYNNIGALVYNKQITNDVNTIQLTGEADGIYFIKMMSDNKIISTKKIIIEK